MSIVSPAAPEPVIEVPTGDRACYWPLDPDAAIRTSRSGVRRKPSSSFDLDFGTLAALAGDRSPSIVLFRLSNARFFMLPALSDGSRPGKVIGEGGMDTVDRSRRRGRGSVGVVSGVIAILFAGHTAVLLGLP